MPLIPILLAMALPIGAVGAATATSSRPPDWFVLRLTPAVALERFRAYMTKPEHIPGHCKYGGAERLVALASEPRRTVAEIEFRLFCFDPIPTPTRFDERKSPAERRAEQIFRTPQFDHSRAMREKFIFVWTGGAWTLEKRQRPDPESDRRE